MIAWFYWDPSRVLFTVPFLHFPIRWYSLCFALGFVSGYLLLVKLLKAKIISTPDLKIESNVEAKKLSQQLVDRLAWYVVLGTIIGARIGHVLFYEPWAALRNDPLLLIRLQDGGLAGLASHGATVGILLALFFYYSYFKKKTGIPFLEFLDLFAIPVPLGAAFIRLGNFFNQEIIGIPTQSSFGVVFLHPMEGGPIVPRHPVQLYEAIAYFIIFIALYCLWKLPKNRLRAGIITGWMFVLIFGSRFFLEFFKAHQSARIDESFLQMGQYLSIPFVLMGLMLLFYTSFKIRRSARISS
jgi:prolipoprotein diacylglyceryl transferase